MKWINKLSGFVFAITMVFGSPMAAFANENVAAETTKLSIPVLFKEDHVNNQLDLASLAHAAKIEKYSEGTLIAANVDGSLRVRVANGVVNVRSKCLAISEEEKDKLRKEQERDVKAQEKRETAQDKVNANKASTSSDEEDGLTMDEIEKRALEMANDFSGNFEYSGEKLNPSAGTIIGPSGKETYYNLPMEGVISIMRSIGNTDEYWVREDGVKMLGDYVMVAAHLPTRPRGSLVPTSLGMGIVCDTGTFALSNHTQLDIAVAW